ncbi:MAG: 50S ribosomal protein L18 [Chloroflexi bacterium]|nr:50S ribosomal protein L18 [Chloroflexota bacterium]
MVSVPTRKKLYRKVKAPKVMRWVRHLRVRKRILGTPERPRLCVFRSLSHIYAQVVDDQRGHTLASAWDGEAELREACKGKNKTQVARLVGGVVARRAAAASIRQVVFDRGGFLYHGRVKALAEGAREGGLSF